MHRAILAAAIQIGFIKMTGCPLDAFETLPVAVLRHLGTGLDIATPEPTSLRALYGRRSTLYEHQVARYRARLIPAMSSNAGQRTNGDVA